MPTNIAMGKCAQFAGVSVCAVCTLFVIANRVRVSFVRRVVFVNWVYHVTDAAAAAVAAVVQATAHAFTIDC